MEAADSNKHANHALACVQGTPAPALGTNFADLPDSVLSSLLGKCDRMDTLVVRRTIKRFRQRVDGDVTTIRINVKPDPEGGDSNTLEHLIQRLDLVETAAVTVPEIRYLNSNVQAAIVSRQHLTSLSMRLASSYGVLDLAFLTSLASLRDLRLVTNMKISSIELLTQLTTLCYHQKNIKELSKPVPVPPGLIALSVWDMGTVSNIALLTKVTKLEGAVRFPANFFTSNPQVRPTHWVVDGLRRTLQGGAALTAPPTITRITVRNARSTSMLSQFPASLEHLQLLKAKDLICLLSNNMPTLKELDLWLDASSVLDWCTLFTPLNQQPQLERLRVCIVPRPRANPLVTLRKLSGILNALARNTQLEYVDDPATFEPFNTLPEV